MSVLKGRKIVVTRPKEQSQDFISKLHRLQAHVVELPLIKLESINPEQLRETFNKGSFDWIIFTSYNAVRSFFDVIKASEVKAKIAVVGPKTEHELKKYGLSSNFLPTAYTGETLAEELPIRPGETVLLPQSNLAKDTLMDILKKRGARVSQIISYQNKSVEYNQAHLAELLKEEIDFITFASGSTVKAFSKLNYEITNEKVICIGPETAKIAKDYHISVDGIAEPHSLEGMIQSMITLENNK